MKNSDTKRILCFGEALIDFHVQAPADIQASSAYVPHAGGAPANVAVALARLGDRSTFVGMLSRDTFGDFLLHSLDQAGVDTRYVRRTDSANTALAFVSLDSKGERSFSFYRPPAADLLFRSEHFDPAAFAGAGVFHACSNSLTEADIAATTLDGMRRARASGALVSFDMNLRPALWPHGEDPLPRVWEALHAADVVKLSADELAFLAGHHESERGVFEQLWHGHARWLIITDGAAPIRWFTPQSSGTLPSFDVPARDSTGAGDAFVGGLLHGLNEAGAKADTLKPLIDDASRRDAVLRFAAACGGIAVSRVGSFSAMPDPAGVENFLNAEGVAVSGTIGEQTGKLSH